MIDRGRAMDVRVTGFWLVMLVVRACKLLRARPDTIIAFGNWAIGRCRIYVRTKGGRWVDTTKPDTFPRLQRRAAGAL